MPAPTPLSPTSALGLTQWVWMGGFRLSSSRPPGYWLMSGQVSRGRTPGRPQGGVRPRGEGTEGPAVAGPTLTGTLETCVLGGSQAPSSELEGIQGDQEPDHVPSPHPGPSLQDAHTPSHSRNLPQQGSPLGGGG